MLKRDPEKRIAASSLQIVLRTFGVMDMIAFIAVVMPTAWMETGHQWAGLGAFPDVPIATYLARSGSLMYGLHGVFLFLLATDTTRYEKLIRWIAAITVAHGAAMLMIDVAARMPLWWIVVEGPAFSFTGVAIRVTQRLATSRAHVDSTSTTIS